VISKHFKTLQRYWQQDSHVTKKITKANTTTKDHAQDADPTTMVKRIPTIVLLTAPRGVLSATAARFQITFQELVERNPRRIKLTLYPHPIK